MREGDIFENYVRDVVGLCGGADGAYAHPARFVADYVRDMNVATVAFDRDAVLKTVSGSASVRDWDGTSPQVTVQLEMTISFEFQVSTPSVLTVLHWELEVAFMSRFVMVTFWEYATNVCLFDSTRVRPDDASSTYQNCGCLQVIPSTRMFVACHNVREIGLPF